MKPIQEVYADCGDEPFYGPCDYEPLLSSIGHEILVKVDQEDYQGDSWLLLRDGNRFGVLVFGWGSCSGCDALQSCDTYQEIDELRSRLAGEVRWGTKEETAAYLREHDWDGDHGGEDAKRFSLEALAALGEPS